MFTKYTHTDLCFVSLPTCYVPQLAKTYTYIHVLFFLSTHPPHTFSPREAFPASSGEAAAARRVDALGYLQVLDRPHPTGLVRPPLATEDRCESL